MSIHRSGVQNSVLVVCLTDIKLDGINLKSGEKYVLVHDLGSMYVLDVDGKEVVAPKDIFKDA